MSTIKVQIIGGCSVKSAVESGIEATKNPLTFHAFSDRMKARILEQMIKSPARIAISFTDEPVKVGEWHEPIVENCIFNRPE